MEKFRDLKKKILIILGFSGASARVLTVAPIDYKSIILPAELQLHYKENKLI